MASERRQFLNKINKRIYTLTQHGVNKQDMLDWLSNQNIDGVYVTEFGQVNIDANKWKDRKDEYIKELEKDFSTYYNAREEAMKAYTGGTPLADFIGPFPENRVDKELQAMYKMKLEFEEQLNTLYKLKDKAEKLLNNVTAKQEYEDAIFKIQEIWENSKLRKVPFTKLLQDLEEIKQKLGV